MAKAESSWNTMPIGSGLRKVTGWGGEKVGFLGLTSSGGNPLFWPAEGLGGDASRAAGRQYCQQGGGEDLPD